MRLLGVSVIFSLWGVEVFARNVVRQVTGPGPVSPPNTPSQTGAPTPSLPGSVLPIPTPTLAFGPLSTMTACSSVTIDWNYSGPSSSLLLEATNQGLAQSPTPSRKNTKIKRQTSGSLLQILGVGLDPTLGNYTWQPINVPQGFYILQAVVGGSTFISGGFQVVNGSDTSCLSASSSTSSSASSSSSSTSTTSDSSPSNSSAALPVTGASSNNNHTGAIVGGVIGGVVLVAVIIIAFLFFSRSSRRRRRASTSRRWGNLQGSGESFKSKRGGDGARHGQSESMGAILSNQDQVTPAVTPGGSEEDITSFAEEKFKSPITAIRPLDNVATLPYGTEPASLDRRTSSAASSVAYQPNHSRGRVTTAASSVSNLNSTTTDSHHRQRSSMDGSTYLSRSFPGQSSPLQSQSPEMIPMARSGSGGARRPARKAVPKYNPADLESDTGPGGSQTDVQTIVVPYIDASQLPNLSHKSSFGPGDNRPVHYLMPDLPPPSQD